jgi:hypothetical protein
MGIRHSCDINNTPSRIEMNIKATVGIAQEGQGVITGASSVTLVWVGVNLE